MVEPLTKWMTDAVPVEDVQVSAPKVGNVEEASEMVVRGITWSTRASEQWVLVLKSAITSMWASKGPVT